MAAGQQTSALIRVVATDITGQQAIDQSDGFFTIQGPPSPPPPTLSVRVISPNGGEVFQVGQSVTILWTVSGASQQRVQYSTDGGASWNPIVTGLSGAQTGTVWSIPPSVVPAGLSQISALVRVVATDASGLQAIDPSDGPFTIQGQAPPPPPPPTGATTVTVDFPNGGTFHGGQTITVQWSSTGPASFFTVRLSIDGGPFNNVSPDLPGSAGRFTLTLPDPLSDLSTGVIRVAAKDSSASQIAKGDGAPFNLLPRTGF